MKNIQTIPLNRLHDIEGVLFMAKFDQNTGNVSIHHTGNKTQVFVDNGDFDSLKRRFDNKRVTILNRGLVDNCTAIEIDVDVERFKRKPRRPVTVITQGLHVGVAA